MVVQSKYDIGDKVFWMENNKIQSSEIWSIDFPTIWICKKGKSKKLEQTSVHYRVKSSLRSFPEPLLYPSKLALINSYIK